MRFAHFADGAGEAAGPAVGDGVVEAAVAGHQEHVEDHFLGDGVADLDGAAGEGFAVAGEFGGTEGGAVDAVAAGASADGHDQVVRLRLLERFIVGQQANVAAVDQRIAEVAGIEIEGAVDGGDAHAVAVVADAGHDAFHHPPGMQHAGRERFGGRIGRGEAEDVGVADGLGAHAGAHRVADHAADARVGPAVGFEGRGVVVGFDLEDDVILIVEADDARVVGEDAYAPIVLAQLLADFLGGGEDRLAEHVVEVALAVGVAIVDAAGERFVAAMLAPGLGDGFQFHVAGIAVEGAEMGLDRPHFGQREVELAFAAEAFEGGVVHRADGHGGEAEFVGRTELQPIEAQRADDHLLDGVVGQHFRAQKRQFVGGQAGDECPLSLWERARVRAARPAVFLQEADSVFLQGADGLGPQAEIGDGLHGALGDGVHHAGFGQDVNPGKWPDRRFGQGWIANWGDESPLDHAIGQQFVGDTLDLATIEVALDQIAVDGNDGEAIGQVQFGGGGGHVAGTEVGLVFGGVNVNFPKHRGSFWRE